MHQWLFLEPLNEELGEKSHLESGEGMEKLRKHGIRITAVFYGPDYVDIGARQTRTQIS